MCGHTRNKEIGQMFFCFFFVISVLRKHPLKLGGQQQEICHKCKAMTGNDLNFGAFNGCSILNVLGVIGGKRPAMYIVAVYY